MHSAPSLSSARDMSKMQQFFLYYLYYDKNILQVCIRLVGLLGFNGSELEIFPVNFNTYLFSYYCKHVKLYSHIYLIILTKSYWPISFIIWLSISIASMYKSWPKHIGRPTLIFAMSFMTLTLQLNDPRYQIKARNLIMWLQLIFCLDSSDPLLIFNQNSFNNKPKVIFPSTEDITWFQFPGVFT